MDRDDGTQEATQAESPKPVTEAKESSLLVTHGFEIARQLGIRKVLVLAELLTDRRQVDRNREDESLIWVTYDAAALRELDEVRDGDECIEIPVAKVERMDQVTFALIISVMNGAIVDDEAVVCLAGVAGSKRLDNLLIANPQRDFPWLQVRSSDGEENQFLSSREFIRLIEIALKFAAEGREGKPIGTIFVLGDPEALEKYMRPLILNPCKGHPRRSRSIHDPGFLETLRELSAIDGAFVVDPKGVLESAGMFLHAPMTKKVKVAKGLGSRHLAAAALTGKVEALAIVISESSGTVTVFSSGIKVISFTGREGVSMS